MRTDLRTDFRIDLGDVSILGVGSIEARFDRSFPALGPLVLFETSIRDVSILGVGSIGQRFDRSTPALGSLAEFETSRGETSEIDERLDRSIRLVQKIDFSI